jgi:hypothetical protein
LTGFTIRINGTIRVDFDEAPSAPKVLGIIFQKGASMAQLLGSVVLSPAAPDVTHRLQSVSLNGGDPFTVDVTDPSATFPCQDGDAVVATVSDVNAVGASTASPPFSVTASAPPTVPVAPTIQAITFALA